MSIDRVRTEKTFAGARNWLYRTGENVHVWIGRSATAFLYLFNAAGDAVVSISGSGEVTARALAVANQAGTDTFGIDIAGELTVTKTLSVILPLDVGGGTADITAFNNSPSINLDADGETFYASFKAPEQWDAASDMTLVMMVGNEIAETDGDDISVTCVVRGYADGETMAAAGQTVAIAQNLTGGDEAIDVVNEASAAIDYNEATYPIAAGDTVTIKATVNITDGTECTGPLHIVAWWVEYTIDKLGA